MNDKYIDWEDYSNFKILYKNACIGQFNYKCRTSVRTTNKINKFLKTIKVYTSLGIILRKTGVPKLLYNNTILDNVRKLTIEEYKFVRLKKRRIIEYYFDPNKIKYTYEKDLVSIVIPLYNQSKYIEECIDSILNQTYSNIELIIVNDGSTDDTLKIVKKYSKKDKRIKIINQNNLTTPLALNNGFKEIKGEYVTWVDGDDILYNNCIEVLVNDLKKHPGADMVYPNIRMVYDDLEPMTDNIWRPTKGKPEVVNMPDSLLNFNIKFERYVPPIMLMKSIVAHTLGPFSKNRFYVEDYDYWMRINSLFTVIHSDTKEPLFDYRRHEESINYNRKRYGVRRKLDELFWFDDFRQDYYVNPIIWVIDDQDKHQDFVNEIKKRELNMIIDSKTANGLILNDIYTSMVYVSFKNNDKLKTVPSYCYKVLVCDKPFKGNKENYDLYISTNDLDKLEYINNQKGFFGISDYSNIFGFIDTKAREYFLRRIEDYVCDKERKEDNIISCAICTYKRTEKVPKVIESLINQSYPKENYEILVINNDIYTDELKKLVDEFRKKYNLSDKFLRYVEAPIKGNAYARAVGGFDARGEYIHWFDDDSVADKDNLKIMNDAFMKYPDACVMGGNIYLVTPDPKPECILEGREVCWSQYILGGKRIKKIYSWWRYPYGANYATLKKYLLMHGIFRLRYGRVGHNWIGGEETASVCHMNMTDKNVYVEPRAFVHHEVQHHRFTFQHVRNTLNQCYKTQAMMEQDMILWPFLHNINQFKRRIRKTKRQYLFCTNKVKRFYLKSDYLGLKKALDFMREEYSERIKYVIFRRTMLNLKNEFLKKRIK